VRASWILRDNVLKAQEEATLMHRESSRGWHEASVDEQEPL